MESILPLAEIETKVPGVQHSVLGRQHLPRIIKGNEDEITLLARFTVDRLEFKKALKGGGKALQQSDPDRHFEVVERLIGGRLIRDVVELRSELNGVEVAHVLAMDVFPGELYLADILFQDPARPRRPTPHDPRDYKSLHLLGTLVDRSRNLAAKRGMKFITLIAATPGLPTVFSRYGFKPYSSMVGRIAAKNGYSTPMELSV